MKIIHLTGLEDSDIKPALRRIADDADRVVACRGQMLLKLVHHLEASGPAPAALGEVVLGELWLWPTDRPRESGVQVRVDWMDYGPVRDGLPEMHYRLSIRRPDSTLSRDERSREPVEVERLVREAFGWSPRADSGPA